MSNLIEHVENESLSKFLENANKILNSKMELAIENEKINSSLEFFKEDADDYEEAEPNMDVDLEPEEFNEDDLKELESIVWDDDDGDAEMDLDEDVEFTFDELEEACANFEELDEVSKALLGRYIKNASVDTTVNGVGLHHAAGKELNKIARNKVNKRITGITKATNRLTKEDVEFDEDLEMTFEQLEFACERFEELDELSKKTLTKYIQKSSADTQHQKERAAKARNASQELANAEYANRTQTRSEVKNRKYNRDQDDSVLNHPDVTKAVRDRAAAVEKDADRRRNNREYGQYRAMKKLTKEDVEYLDELSKKTLGSYINKAKDSHGNAASEWGSRQAKFDHKQRSISGLDHETDRETSDHLNKAHDSLIKNHNKSQSKLSRTIYKRDKGIKTAVNKLTKEEVEYLDELSKKTLGSYVKKASNDMAVKHGKHQTKKAEAEEVDRFTNRNMKDKFDARDKMKKSIDADDESLSKIRRKVGNRSKGIDRAADKLSKD